MRAVAAGEGGEPGALRRTWSRWSSDGGAFSRWGGIGTLAGTACIGLLVLLVVAAVAPQAVAHADGRDVDAYWGAAMRLREGEPLYVPGAPTDSDVYRYAPWFAYAWVPLTYLPENVVVVTWVAVMVAAALLSTAPLLRGGLAGLCAFALITPFQLDGAAYGNVQPLLVLMLVAGIEHRPGPLWIAIGASLKGVPIVLALVYFARGEYRRGLAAIGLTAIFTAPMLLHDLGGYNTATGQAQMSLSVISPMLFVAGALAACGAIFLLRKTRFAWLAAGVAMVAALPRLLTYEIGFLLVAIAPTWSADLRSLMPHRRPSS